MIKKETRMIALVMVFSVMFSTVTFAKEKEDADVTTKGECSVYAPNIY